MNSEEYVDLAMTKSSNGIGSRYGSNWDPVISLSQSGDIRNSSVIPQNEFRGQQYSVLLENPILERSSNLVHFPSESDLVDTVPNVTTFGGGCFSKMVDSFGNIQSANHSNFTRNTERASRNAADSMEPCRNTENGALETCLNGKRRRNVLLGASFKNAEEKQEKDPFEDAKSPKKQGEKDQKMDENDCTNVIGTQSVNKAKDNVIGAEPGKENYLHMRAKKGQATSSHSLAERVRRERISERMKLLQELVPGCNKITGKALMLDEIINYVQSLQHQVEFLSMKLATVNPELDVDIEQISSKHIFNFQGSNATTFGIDSGLSPYETFPGLSHGNFHGIPSTSTPFHPLPYNVWNNELQSILQMGIHPSQSGQMGSQD